ncbi:unnamed protein product [Ostreobium quekettii]|uniref:Uncharacterized protein n=1 Tax=Ostreobium quekettii TaxID=121088 RepID=A0A8S1J207_9CHLO|nr:unnamed protein product [Ostreobium quekettii]|eukprot:evm.model.scf_411.3 EVM.evm.TU.scf_411.3   scf_411:51895-53529(-)
MPGEAAATAEALSAPCCSGSPPAPPRCPIPSRRHRRAFPTRRRRFSNARRLMVMMEAGGGAMSIPNVDIPPPRVLEEIGPPVDVEGGGSGEGNAPGKPLKINRDLLLYRCRVRRRRAETAAGSQRSEMLREAEEGYRRVISMDATDGRSYVGLGRLMVQQRRFEEARKVYEGGCTATQGCNAYVWTAWANLEAMVGSVPRARKLYDAAVVADRGHQAAWHGWGMLEKREGDYARARDCWIKGIRNAGRAPSPYLFNSLAVLAAGLGRQEEAREWFSKGTRTAKGAGSFALWQAWALMEAENGDKEAAQGLFGRALEVNPRSRYTYLAWALFEKDQGRLDKALELLEKGHRLNRRDPAILQAWGVLEAQMGNFDKAGRLFEKGTRADRNTQRVWQAWGVMEFRRGNVGRARELFQEGVWAGPNTKDVAYVFQAWGVLEMGAGNTVLARELFKCAVKADPKNETTWSTWVQLEERLGAYERANELRNMSMQRRVEVVVPRSFTTLEDKGSTSLQPLFEKISEWFQNFGTLSRDESEDEQDVGEEEN